MSFTDDTITPKEIEDFTKRLFEVYHDAGIDEPYSDAGYCACDICQELVPRFLAAKRTIEEAEEEANMFFQMAKEGVS